MELFRKETEKIFVCFLLGICFIPVNALPPIIACGNTRTEDYFPLLRQKKIAVTANHTSLINGKHLVDSLLSAGFTVVGIFCPEHGFRGAQEAGEKVHSYRDRKTGLPVISLYGKNKKPSPAELKDVDIMLFDIQDVGVRCYTYLSTLHYVMEACAEKNIPVIVLDRPNPNGFYIDGPVLEKKYLSFAGLHPVPLVYGMTIGEYARMINGEGWLKNGIRCDLHVVTCKHYTHDSLYMLPVRPSPNLPTMRAVYLYPSLVLFEGTVIHVGRKTSFPFEVFGHPEMTDVPFSYTVCTGKEKITYHGMDLRNIPEDSLVKQKFTLRYLLYAYQHFPDKEHFFNPYFYNLSGCASLKKMIIEGADEETIRQTWQPELKKFISIRSKYLLYP